MRRWLLLVPMALSAVEYEYEDRVHSLAMAMALFHYDNFYAGIVYNYQFGEEKCKNYC